MRKILILGCTGMLGHVLMNEFSQKGSFEVFGTTRNTYANPDFHVYTSADACDICGIENLLKSLKPDIVINAIGIIKQLPEAADSIISIKINSLFPHEVAAICEKISVRLIHISTDCVFSGRKGNYNENDFADADDLYGRSKYLGEVKYPNCVTLRTSIIGHELRGKFGLIEWFLGSENLIKGYTSAIYTGFPTIELAHIIADIVIPNQSLSGLYHVSSNPISKFDLLTLVAHVYGKEIEIEPFDMIRDNKSLDSSLFRKVTGYTPPSWEILIDNMHRAYIKNRNMYRP